jgi:uncharacterized protein
MHDLMVQDEMLPVSWRSRRGDFVSLMTLYESNYVRLKRLIPALRQLNGSHESRVQGDCRLTLCIEDHAAYTSTFNLTYLFDSGAGEFADPDLQVRVYHDAHLAEVLDCARQPRHRVLASLKSHLHGQLNERWCRNMMLNKWLDYCVERGHLFALTS